MAADNWYIDWFNSPYYHVLYKNRDFKEAELFIDNLLKYLNPSPDSHFLDMACGKGRHSIYLNKKGYVVTGIDLSTNNIKSASKFANSTLHFLVQDMREAFKGETFDYVVNLFTSFGYFANEGDNLKVLKAAYTDLKPGGTLIIDFFNSPCIIDNLKDHEVKKCGGITFKIHKKKTGNIINKDIEFKDNDKDYHFVEKVKAYSANDLVHMLKEVGFTVKNIFGNYKLSKFDENISERLIIEAVK